MSDMIKPRRGAEILSSLPARSPEKSVAQLTIFYGGSVHVYDNVPADKVCLWLPARPDYYTSIMKYNCASTRKI